MMKRPHLPLPTMSWSSGSRRNFASEMSTTPSCSFDVSATLSRLHRLNELSRWCRILLGIVVVLILAVIGLILQHFIGSDNQPSSASSLTASHTGGSDTPNIFHLNDSNMKIIDPEHQLHKLFGKLLLINLTKSHDQNFFHNVSMEKEKDSHQKAFKDNLHRSQGQDVLSEHSESQFSYMNALSDKSLPDSSTISFHEYEISYDYQTESYSERNSGKYLKGIELQESNTEDFIINPLETLIHYIDLENQTLNHSEQRLPLAQKELRNPENKFGISNFPSLGKNSLDIHLPDEQSKNENIPQSVLLLNNKAIDMNSHSTLKNNITNSINSLLNSSQLENIEESFKNPITSLKSFDNIDYSERERTLKSENSKKPMSQPLTANFRSVLTNDIKESPLLITINPLESETRKTKMLKHTSEKSQKDSNIATNIKSNAGNNINIASKLKSNSTIKQQIQLLSLQETFALQSMGNSSTSVTYTTDDCNNSTELSNHDYGQEYRKTNHLGSPEDKLEKLANTGLGFKDDHSAFAYTSYDSIDSSIDYISNKFMIDGTQDPGLAEVNKVVVHHGGVPVVDKTQKSLYENFKRVVESETEIDKEISAQLIKADVPLNRYSGKSSSAHNEMVDFISESNQEVEKNNYDLMYKYYHKTSSKPNSPDGKNQRITNRPVEGNLNPITNGQASRPYTHLGLFLEKPVSFHKKGTDKSNDNHSEDQTFHLTSQSPLNDSGTKNLYYTPVSGKEFGVKLFSHKMKRKDPLQTEEPIFDSVSEPSKLTLNTPVFRFPFNNPVSPLLFNTPTRIPIITTESYTSTETIRNKLHEKAYVDSHPFQPLIPPKIHSFDYGKSLSSNLLSDEAVTKLINNRRVSSGPSAYVRHELPLSTNLVHLRPKLQN